MIKVNMKHPKGRLITNTSNPDVAALFLEAYISAAKETNQGWHVELADAYNYRAELLYNYQAIVLVGKYTDVDLSEFSRAARAHPSYRKAMEII